MACPDGCSYLAPNNAFSCLFECVPREECSASNPNNAFPDPVSGLCAPCDVEGCKLCDSRGTCSECHPQFTLSQDRQKCEFWFDKAMKPDKFVKVLGALICGLVLLALAWRVCKGRHPQLERNLVAIQRARRHRHLSKVQSWNLDGRKQVRHWYNVTMGLHHQDIMGVGLPLFYNNIVFMIVVSGIFLGVTYAVYTMNGVSQSLKKFEDPAGSLADQAFRPHGLEPAVVFSPLASCGRASAADIKAELFIYAGWNFQAIGGLYVVTFVLSLLFTLYQRRFAINFDRENVGMVDYAIAISGLPCDCTDEAGLQAWLQEEFRKARPELVPRPPKVTHRSPPEADLVEERQPSEIEVFGVSLCYNYRERWAEVDDAMWKLMEQMEVDMHQRAKYDDWLMDDMSTTAADRDMSLEAVAHEERKRVKAWFDEGSESKLKGTGEAFVVFRYIDDKERVIEHFDAHPDFLRHPSAPSEPVSLRPVFSEPPTVHWWHAGVPKSTLVKRTALNVFYILLVIAAVQIFLVLPYAFFILYPYASTGDSAGGTKMTIAGIVLGNVNGLLFMTNYNTAARLGYSRKDKMDAFVLFANTLLVLVNTFFNIATTAWMVTAQTNMESAAGFFEIRTLKAIGTENALARNLYQMMMPGSFFVGLVMWAVMAGIVPFIWNSFLMKLIYVWSCLPQCLLKVLKVFLPWAPPGLEHYPFRSAEKAFEPAEVSISGNYADQIVTPTVCFSMLFFLSPFVWRAFLGMLLWSIFEYCYFRWLHLRFCKVCYYTTHRLDCFANFLWGMPLSVVAAACCHWGLRAQVFAVGWPFWAKLLLVVATFLTSAGLWLLCYRFIVNPLQDQDADEWNHSKTVEELSCETVYSWLNCNPPYVLKCKYYFQDEKGADIPARRKGHPLACGEDPEEVRFFEIGKQYLFLKPERQALVYKGGVTDPLEFETYFEAVLAVMGAFWTGVRSTGALVKMLSGAVVGAGGGLGARESEATRVRPAEPGAEEAFVGLLHAEAQTAGKRRAGEP
uniref:CSC1/OSCA1-like cytosolic domain-containing protein n=1 Tax=Alexandrium monilatum TaxID=311494 RepID=A0A7S4RBT7_9DINO